MRPVRLSAAAVSSPAVSITVKVRSPSRATPSRRSRVTPGRSSTKASRLPTSRLNRVDLPTLGRPRMATVKLIGRAPAGWRSSPLHAAARRQEQPGVQAEVQSAQRRRIRPLDAAGLVAALWRWRIRPLCRVAARLLLGPLLGLLLGQRFSTANAFLRRRWLLLGRGRLWLGLGFRLLARRRLELLRLAI